MARSGSALARTTISSRNTPGATRAMRTSRACTCSPCGKACHAAATASATAASSAPARTASRPRRTGTRTSMAAPVTRWGDGFVVMPAWFASAVPYPFYLRRQGFFGAIVRIRTGDPVRFRTGDRRAVQRRRARC
ncbi:conserved hypothetical protein [Ricinus communis]|uniref:Uncharacterized protein n=1 Tax=Ricinus communis TaxID=3988 RepID=B9THZ0_RICCO|nr:conserved hypothetical protein [Ricinus communis]